MTCKNCGECCCSVAFKENERHLVRKIARGLNLQWKKLEWRHSKSNIEIRYLPYIAANADEIETLTDYPSLAPTNIPCPFLQKDRKTGQTKCVCYDVRPEICRTFGTHGHNNPLLYCESFCR